MTTYVLTFIFMIVALLSAGNALGQNEALNENLLRPRMEYSSTLGKNPFSSYIEEEKQREIQEQAEIEEKKIVADVPAFTIQGIVWGGRLPQAIINHKVYKVGDLIEDARIEKIDKNGVTVSFKDRLVTLDSPSVSEMNNIMKTQEGGKDVK